MKILRSRKGMTVAELLVASTFALFLTSSIFAFTSFFNRAQYEYQSNIELTNDARRLIEKMVWGPKLTSNADRKGIAEAVSGTVVSSTQFSYNDVNGTTHTLRWNNGVIEYRRGAGGAWNTILDVNGAAAYDATKYTTTVNFAAAPNPNSVLVKVIVGKSILGRWYYGSASTQVYYRNA